MCVWVNTYVYVCVCIYMYIYLSIHACKMFGMYKHLLNYNYYYYWYYYLADENEGIQTLWLATLF